MTLKWARAYRLLAVGCLLLFLSSLIRQTDCYILTKRILVILNLPQNLDWCFRNSVDGDAGS